jgi:hypothetical protein
MIEIRKLAAIDMAFLGPRLIIAEFALGLFGTVALGLFTLSRAHSAQQVILAAYFIALGINYAPLLVYALAIARTGSARAEVADEVSADRRRAMRKYRRGSLLLLLPFVVPVLAIAQEHRRPT